MKGKKPAETIYFALVCIIPIIYVIYNFYLTYSIANGNMSGIYTNIQGMVYLFVYYAATLMGNCALVKEKKKVTLYIFSLMQIGCVILYMLNIYVEFNLLALMDIIVISFPFVTGIIQNMSIKE